MRFGNTGRPCVESVVRGLRTFWRTFNPYLLQSLQNGHGQEDDLLQSSCDTYTIYTRILLADFFNIGYSKILARNPLKQMVLVILVISLLSDAKQLAETLYLIMVGVFCMQVLYCLASAFFRIEMLNCFSSTFINSLNASARRDS